MPNMWRFNNTLFNSWALWQWSGGLSDIVIFNGFWLLNETYVTTKLNVWNMPSINLLQVSNPKSDWGTLLDRFYKERTITVEWHILAENYEDMQQKIDNLKKALSSKQWYFEFKFWEKYRRILCTLTNSDIINRESYDIDHWEFSHFQSWETFSKWKNTMKQIVSMSEWWYQLRHQQRMIRIFISYHQYSCECCKLYKSNHNHNLRQFYRNQQITLCKRYHWYQYRRKNSPREWCFNRFHRKIS